jgi:hypothetical protein
MTKAKMLIWKVNSDKLEIASFRYRCLLPIAYLEKMGCRSLVYYGKEQINFRLKPQAAIFVKSFTPHDLKLAQQASQAGIPIILDLCDNILVDDYGWQSSSKPQVFFREMSKLASMVVTTGEALKSFIEDDLNSKIPIVVIRDGNETVADFNEYKVLLDKNEKSKRIISRLDVAANLKRIILAIEKNIKTIKKNVEQNAIRTKKHTRKIIKSKIKGLKSRIKHIYLRLRSLNRENPIAPDRFNDREISSNLTLEIERIEEVEIVSIVDSPAECEDEEPDNWIAIREPESSDFDNEYQHLKKIIWFGNHGIKPGIGMLSLLDIKDDLIEVYQKIGFCLHIVSDNYEKYCQYIQPLPFPTRYTTWDFFVSRESIGQSDVTIVPTSLDAFNICKSANRAVLSLSLGVPVVATKIPALVPFQDCIILDNWQSGILSYLTDGELVKQHIAQAQTIIDRDYSGEAIACQWSDVINRVVRQKI